MGVGWVGTEGEGADTATRKELSNKKCSYCCDKHYHVVLRPLELLCEKNVEEFGTLY